MSLDFVDICCSVRTFKFQSRKLSRVAGGQAGLGSTRRHPATCGRAAPQSDETRSDVFSNWKNDECGECTQKQSDPGSPRSLQAVRSAESMKHSWDLTNIPLPLTNSRPTSLKKRRAARRNRIQIVLLQWSSHTLPRQLPPSTHPGMPRPPASSLLASALGDH